MQAASVPLHGDSMGCDAAFHDSLRTVVPTLWELCADRWCIIGSAAARMVGVETAVADIDVLCTTRDAETLMLHWAEQRDRSFAPAGSDRFRSHFARFHLATLPVEIMGNLEVCAESIWQRLDAHELGEYTLDDLRVPIPTIEGQIRILEMFGRRKDLERAVLLRGLTKQTSSI